jgi:hypothetical protein
VFITVPYRAAILCHAILIIVPNLAYVSIQNILMAFQTNKLPCLNIS